MAYPCQLWLKSECDGCGACDDPMLVRRCTTDERYWLRDLEEYEEDDYDNVYEDDEEEEEEFE